MDFNPFLEPWVMHMQSPTPNNVAGKGQMTITDMTGRTVSRQSVDLTSGSNDVTVTTLRDLKAGLYLVKFTLPTGEMKNLKVVKQ